jgi:hypothetical protein
VINWASLFWGRGTHTQHHGLQSAGFSPSVTTGEGWAGARVGVLEAEDRHRLHGRYIPVKLRCGAPVARRQPQSGLSFVSFLLETSYGSPDGWWEGMESSSGHDLFPGLKQALTMPWDRKRTLTEVLPGLEKNSSHVRWEVPVWEGHSGQPTSGSRFCEKDIEV